MNFVRFKIAEDIKSGVIIDKNLYSFEDLFDCNIDLINFVKNFKEEDINFIINRSSKEKALKVEDVTILSPFKEPIRNIICLGKNYLEHVTECDTGGIDKNIGKPNYPIYFSKMVNAFVDPYSSINLHQNLTKFLDYEGELAVIIGKECKNIDPEEVENHIFGYSIINDTSARDLQKNHSQWLRGKSLDDTTSFGPSILYKNQISFPPKLKIETKINGELRQSDCTNNLIFDIAYCISQLSNGITLKKGDIIATGTPAGVGMGFKPEKLLKNGDIIEIEIEKIGKLINKVENN